MYFINFIIIFCFSIYVEGLVSSPNNNKNFNPSQWNSQLKQLLSNHPALLSMQEQVRAISYNQEIQGRLPDLQLGLAYRNYPTRSRTPLLPNFRDRDDFTSMTGKEIFLSQEIPYPQKLSSEKKIALLDHLSEKEKYHILKNEFIVNYYSLLLESHFLQKEKELLQKIIQLQTSILKISGSGYSTGKIKSFTFLEEENNLRKWKERSLLIQSKLKETKELLHYYEIALSMEEIQIMIEWIPLYLHELFSKLINQVNEFYSDLKILNPILRSYDISLQKLEEEERLTKLNYIPDSELFVGYMLRNSKLFRISQNPLNFGQIMPIEEYTGDLVSFGVTLKIPSWSIPTTNSKAKQIHSIKKKEFYEKLAYEKKLITDIKSSIQRIKGYEERIQYYNQDILPNLKKSSKISSVDFENQEFNLSSLNFAREYYIANYDLLGIEKEKLIIILNLLEIIDKLESDNI